MNNDNPGNHEAEFVQIHGNLYRCRVSYRSSVQLDHFADFFFRHVLAQESDVARIVSSFGLPKRMVADILGELLRRNLARINAADRRIYRVAAEESRAAYDVESGATEVKVWQDDVTGVLLPISLVDDYRRKPDPRLKRTLLTGRHGERTVEDRFDAMPGERAIQFLNVADPRCLLRSEADDPADWTPVDLVQREWIRACPIYVRILQTEIEPGRPFDNIHAPRISRRQTMAWTARLQAQRQQGGDDLDRLLAAAIHQRENSDPILADSIYNLRLIVCANVWQHAARKLTDAVPADDYSDPLVSRQYRAAVELEVECRQQMLEACRRTAHAHAALRAPGENAVSHVCEIGQAEKHILIVTREVTDDFLAQLSDARCECVVITNSARQKTGDMSRTSHLHVLSTNRFLPFECCVIDGHETRFGNAKTLLSCDPLLTITETALAKRRTDYISEVLLAPTGSQARPGSDTDELHYFTFLIRRTGQPGTPSTEPDRERLFREMHNELQEFDRKADAAATSLTARRSTARQAVIDGRRELTTSDEEEPLGAIAADASVSEEEKRTLFQIDESLLPHTENIRSRVLTLHDEGVLINDLSRYSMVDLLFDALQLGKNGDIATLSVVVSQVHPLFRKPAVADAIRQATAVGLVFRMIVGSHESPDAAVDFETAVTQGTSSRTSVAFLNHNLPELMILGGTKSPLTVIGSFQVHEQPLSCCDACESPVLDSQLRDLFARA